MSLFVCVCVCVCVCGGGGVSFLNIQKVKYIHTTQRMCYHTALHHLWCPVFFSLSSLRKVSRKLKIPNTVGCYCCFYLLQMALNCYILYAVNKERGTHSGVSLCCQKREGNTLWCSIMLSQTQTQTDDPDDRHRDTDRDDPHDTDTDWQTVTHSGVICLVQTVVEHDPDDPQEGDQHVKAIASTGPVAHGGQCYHLHGHLQQHTLSSSPVQVHIITTDTHRHLYKYTSSPEQVYIITCTSTHHHLYRCTS